ncbi:MAG: folylpolyglutamate synthase/dihydrofolate synthase family protein [Ferruginibacter sp.]
MPSQYEQTIEYLYSQLPMYSRIGAAAYKENLNNITSLCEALGNPQNKFRSIHVAGTNGKGSTCHMLASVLQTAGYKTGLCTSPHIHTLEERVRVNGVMMDKEFVVSFVARTKAISEKIQPSFFELTIAMAFEYFAQQKIDIAVIETGLGGRLDSTNIIVPILSIITNISRDHTQILGNKLEEIAFEKAGIIKNNIPVIIGEVSPETLPVFIKKANENKAVLHIGPEMFVSQFIDEANSLLLCNIHNTRTDVVEKLRLDLTGLYQVKNACTVLAAIEIVRAQGFEISEAALHTGLENVKKITGISGRWEMLGQKPTIIADVAHNEGGISQVISQLSIHYPKKKLHFVLGFVKDKDIDHVLKLFPADAKYYFTNANIPRALLHTDLMKKANENGLFGKSYDNVNEALNAAKKMAAKEDVIIICGSFFIIAELDTNLFPGN